MPVTLNNTTITIDDGTNNFVLETVKTHVPEVNIDKTITNEPTATPSVPTQIPADMYQYHILTYEGTAGYTSTTDGNQRSYNINFDENVVADILVVGGGGAGAMSDGGGGGAGSCIVSIGNTFNGSYTIKVGKGGEGGAMNSSAIITKSSTNGFNTSIFDNSGVEIFRAVGGGRGGGYENNNNFTSLADFQGKDGGCGGGGGFRQTTSGTPAGNPSATNIVNGIPNKSPVVTSTYGIYGNSGGLAQQWTTNNYSTANCGGGGGIGTPGAPGVASLNRSGVGGDGLNQVVINSVTYNLDNHFLRGMYGVNGYIGGGGGGGGYSNSNAKVSGGLGGGGTGDNANVNSAFLDAPANGVQSTGSGGGGGPGNANANGGNGGSGIVIIRYYYVSSITHKYLALTHLNNPYPVLNADSTNLVAHYKFDDDTNKGLNSSVSPNSIGDTTYNGTPTLNSSEYVIGKSSYFSGSGDHAFVLDNNTDNLYNAIHQKPITISFWCKSLGNGGQNFGRMFYGAPTGSGNNINSFQCVHWSDTGDGQIDEAQLTFIISNNNEGQDNNFMYSTQLPSFNTTWSHIAFVIEPQSTNWTTKEHTAKIYVNGVLDKTYTNIWYPSITQNYDFEIGRWTTNEDSREYNGYLDDFRIYDKALSHEEVSKLYTDINTPTTYTLNVPEDTTCDVLVINNTQAIKATGATFNGTYNVIVGSNSKIEKDGTYLYVPNSGLSIIDNITGESISYGLNNPIVIIRYSTKYIRQHPAYDAQWTYHSTNPNVHHYGNVGIGALASETNKLTVKGDVNVIGDIYENNNKIAYGWNVSGNSIYNQFGNVGIGTTDPRYGLDTTGIIYAGQGGITESGSTTWTITSDNRIKDNIEKASYDICSENIKNINLYRFNYNDKYVKTTDKNQLGFIAQDVRKYFPKAVKNKTTKFDGEVIHNLLSVDVTQMNYAMYGAVKHIGQDIDAIKEKLGITEVPTEIKNEPYAIEVDPFNDPDAELPIVNEEPATN